MAENQAAHRIRTEEQIIAAAVTSEHMGRWCATIIALAFLGVSGWLINGGHDLAGGALGTLDLVSLAVVFIQGRKPTRQDDLDAKKSHTADVDRPQPRRPPQSEGD